MIADALLGGPKSDWPLNMNQVLRQSHCEGHLLIGVDRGSILLTEMGLLPDVAIGDFDSLRQNEKLRIDQQVVDVRYSNPVKDYTDTELMLRTALNDYRVEKINIFGATGGRLDHLLANLWMVFAPAIRSSAEKIVMVDRQNRMGFYLPGLHRITAKKDYSYFGVAALSGVKDLNILGARYQLRDYSCSFPRIFTSNEFIAGHDEFTLAFNEGIVAVIFSKDIDRYYNLK